MVNKHMNKFVAAMAVFAMMFAGFGAILYAEANDADPVADKDITISFTGDVVYGEGESAAMFAPGVIKYKVTLVEDNFDNIPMVYYDTYNTLIKPFVTTSGEDIVAYFGEADYLITDLAFKKVLEVLTDDHDAGTADDLAAATSKAIVFDMNLATALDIVGGDFATSAKAKAIAIATAFATVPAGYISEGAAAAAVAAAIIATEAEYADYLSPEEVEELIADLYTEEEVQKAIAEATAGLYTKEQLEAAIQKAIDEYKAAHPAVVKQDETFVYVSIIVIALAIVLGVTLIYLNVVKPKLAKKKEPKVI